MKVIVLQYVEGLITHFPLRYFSGVPCSLQDSSILKLCMAEVRDILQARLLYESFCCAHVQKKFSRDSSWGTVY